jgi:polar amino acid transport system permease protein
LSTDTERRKARDTRRPTPPSSLDEVAWGATFELLAAWLLLVEGAVALIFLPVIVFSSEVDIPAGDIATFGGLGACLIVGGALLYSRWAGAWWVAFAVALGVAAWLVLDKGLTSWTEVYIGVGIAIAQIVLLLLGRPAAGEPDSLALASAKIPFRLKVALVWLATFSLIGLFLALSDLDVAWMRENARYISFGLVYTIALAVGAIVLAVVLALFGALGRLSHNAVAYGLSGFYTSFFRGTPLIVQLFLIYFALPQIGGNLNSLSLVNVLTLTAFQAGVIGLGLNYGAYMTEIFRAGIQSVGHGQAEAADALGMSYVQRMRRVVLPQALRVVVPPTGNEFIAMMKDTALVSFLGVELARAELFRRSTQAGNQDLRRLESFLLAAAMYWALTAIFTYFQSRLERRLAKGYVRAAASTARQRRPKLLSMGQAQPGIGVTPPADPRDLGASLPEDDP